MFPAVIWFIIRLLLNKESDEFVNNVRVLFLDGGKYITYLMHTTENMSYAYY